ncbi:MAG: hypothetical protein ACQESD_00080 [Thermoplasmatota archaeon]
MTQQLKLAVIFLSGLLLLMISPYFLIIAGIPMIYISRVYWKRVVTSEEDSVVCGCDFSGGGQLTRGLPKNAGLVPPKEVDEEEYNIGILLASIGLSWIVIGFAYMYIFG